MRAALLALAPWSSRASRPHLALLLGSDASCRCSTIRRAAEDAAMVDASGGRLPGAAIGYRPDELPLPHAAGEGGARLRRPWPIRALWTEDAVTHPGPHYPLRGRV